MANTNTTAPEKSDARDFKASDLLKLAGLTYRQLHDWENRAGVMTSQRATGAGWRKFTAEEVAALCVCASLRRQFSFPLEKVGGLFGWLLSPPRDSLERFIADRGKQSLAVVESEVAQLRSLTGDALKKALADDRCRFVVSVYLQASLDALRVCPIRYAFSCARRGYTVYLYTDFEDSIILFEENMANVIVERFPTGPGIVCPLNTVFDEFLAAAGKSVLARDTLTKPLSAKWQELQNRIQLTEDEREVVGLIREKAYQRVTIHLNDGRIVRADVEEDLSKSGAAKRDRQILDAIKANDFSTVTVQKADGQIVRLSRKSTVKFDRVTGKT
jgi:DNA-binding transcriptional MerR regulator